MQSRRYRRTIRRKRAVLSPVTGNPQAEARMLLMFAFTNDVIENVRMDALKDRLRQLVEKKISRRTRQMCRMQYLSIK